MTAFLRLFFLLSLSAHVLSAYYLAHAEGTYSSIGTLNAADGSSDALNFSQSRVWTIDKYGKYIWLTQERATTSTSWAWSNDLGATWTQGAQSYGFLTRGSVAYDSENDHLHVIWDAADSNDGVIYRAYSITRDGSNNITAITRDVTGTVGYEVNLQLQTSGSRELAQPVALWIDDGTTNGILVALWSINGGSLADVRGSMRRLSYSGADGIAGNWLALDGSADSISTDAPAVASDVVFHATSGTVIASADIRGGSGSFKDDLYVFAAVNTDDSSGTVRAYRAAWSSGSLNWSGGWQSPVTLGAMDTSTGYGLKEELITKPVLDTTNDRLYVAWPRWKTGGDGDTVSFAYLNSSNVASSTFDAYSALGTHSYAPTVDLAYDADTDWVYIAYVDSTTNGTNGSIDYKTFDGSTLSTSTRFYTTPGGSGGENGSADIPILYKSRSSNNRLLFAFRINGALPPSALEPHEVYWGYISLDTQPTVAFSSANSTGSESSSAVSIPVTLSKTFVRDITVNYSVTGGTATGSGTDFTLSSGTLTFTAGDTSENIALTVVNDSSDENDETIVITLSSPTFSSLGGTTSLTYTITDDDTTPAASDTDSDPNSCSKPEPEKNVKIKRITKIGGRDFEVRVTDASDHVSDYDLEYGYSADNLKNRIKNLGNKNSQTFIISVSDVRDSIYFRVRNNNGCSNGEWSKPYKYEHPVAAVTPFKVINAPLPPTAVVPKPIPTQVFPTPFYAEEEPVTSNEVLVPATQETSVEDESPVTEAVVIDDMTTPGYIYPAFGVFSLLLGLFIKKIYF